MSDANGNRAGNKVLDWYTYESDDYYIQDDLFRISWALHEGYKDISEKLDDLIPLEGAVPQGRSVNKCLEKFRVAQNLIYDLFNNGPRQPLRLSYLINPFLKEFVAIFCNSRFIGVFILKPWL